MRFHHFVGCLFVAICCASPQQVFLPDTGGRIGPVAPTNVSGKIYQCDPATGTALAVESQEVLVRFPLVTLPAPKARGILLVDSPGNSQVAYSPGRVFLTNNPAAPKSEYLLHVMLDQPRTNEPAWVVTLGESVFWNVRVSRFRDPGEEGMITLPLGAAQKPAQCLRIARGLFGVEERFAVDLRLSDEERTRPAKVTGSLAKQDIEEIRQTVFAMARRQILENLATRSPEAWLELLRQWPGRHALDISATDGRMAAVYYAPNAGYQLERINGKWMIVGG